MTADPAPAQTAHNAASLMRFAPSLIAAAADVLDPREGVSVTDSMPSPKRVAEMQEAIGCAVIMLADLFDQTGTTADDLRAHAQNMRDAAMQP